MILFCANEIVGTTGYHKSLVENANALSRAGYRVGILTFMESPESRFREPLWPLDTAVSVLSLKRLAADGGRLLHLAYHPVTSVRMGSTSAEFTFNDLAVLRRINELLTPEDTVIFTSPMQAVPFHRALEGQTRRPRTILQIHGDYRVHEGLWDLMMEARSSIDRLRTISSGLVSMFVPTFDEADVVFIPNASGETAQLVEPRKHDGVNIALPASFQPRKNQIDAIHALSKLRDSSARLILWGAINSANPYLRTVRELVEDLNLGDRVQIAGFGTEEDVYSTADIVLMTSSSEGFGRPLIEAAFNGLPTVTYDFEFGPRDAVEDGESGFIVSVGDVAGLAERLEALVSDESLRHRFGRRAREVYDERFATEKIVGRHRTMLGPESGTVADLAEELSPNSREPIAARELIHRVQHSYSGTVHWITVAGGAFVHDVLVDDGHGVRTAKAQRSRWSTRIAVRTSSDSVISYAPAPASTDRHYLANITREGRLEVLPWLRRDAGGRTTGFTRVAVATLAWHWWVPAQMHWFCVRIGRRLRRLPGDVAWKVRHL
jgi:glycosyltransferase involved in cell wall biosynthesis